MSVFGTENSLKYLGRRDQSKLAESLDHKCTGFFDSEGRRSKIPRQKIPRRLTLTFTFIIGQGSSDSVKSVLLSPYWFDPCWILHDFIRQITLITRFEIPVKSY